MRRLARMISRTMTEPQATLDRQKSDPPALGLHVLNGGWGESIILELPDGRWGVIDCYTQDLADPASNQTLQFLRRRQVTELEFVALTHPHTDHFRGLSQIFEAMTVRQFWRYGAFSPRDLAALQVGAVVQQAASAGDADDLLHLLEITAGLRTRKRLKFKHLVDEKTLSQGVVPDGDGGGVEISIRCIAPSSNDVERYQKMLSRCFDTNRHLKETYPSLPHNMISAALVVEFGETRLVLGGDVENAGWRTILEDQGSDRLRSDAIKVSHHGSRNGYCEGLWAALCHDRNPVAVITPYLQQGLPENVAYRHIRSHTTRTVTTCLPAITFTTAPRYDLWPHLDAGIQIGIRAFFRSGFRADPGYHPGVCSFYFDAHRHHVTHDNEFSGAAGPI